MISVVLPTYCPSMDAEKKLERCLQSIALYTEEPMELIVVEQGIPAFARYMHSFASGGRRVAYRRYPKAVGHAKAVNVGVSMAEGDYFLIVNNDIVVDRGWARDLVTVYDATKGIAMLSASDTGCLSEQRIETPCAWWSCVCISRAVWDLVGPLDDDRLNYRLHDQDWSIRAYTKGLTVGRYHGVKVQHEESSTYKLMLVDEGAERAEMRARWGVEYFFEYVARHPKLF